MKDETHFYHGHHVVADRCEGSMRCMRRCPAEAIRVHGGKAVILEELCVDCGTCITACPNGAVVHDTDEVARPDKARNVVVPTPALYTQLDPELHPYLVHLAFKEMGFDGVVDVGEATRCLVGFLGDYLREYDGPLPVISPHCPSVARLIQVKYPALVDHVLHVDVPRELTAKSIKELRAREWGITPDDISVTYIAPCTAKIVSIRQPMKNTRSWFDEVITIRDLYPRLLPLVTELNKTFDPATVPEDFEFTRGWAFIGGYSRSLEMPNWLAVSGMEQVIRILDDIENGRLRNIDYVEALAHTNGCVSGPMTIENPYVARTNGIKLHQRYGRSFHEAGPDVSCPLDPEHYLLPGRIQPRESDYFSGDLATSIKKMRERERVYSKLRKIDCGLCGAPTCMAFAEDAIRGHAKLTDCVFLSGKLDMDE